MNTHERFLQFVSGHASEADRNSFKQWFEDTYGVEASSYVIRFFNVEGRFLKVEAIFPTKWDSVPDIVKNSPTETELSDRSDASSIQGYGVS